MKITDFELFDETMNSIGAYLLVAPEKHPKYLLGKPTDSLISEKRSTPALRLTQHYVSALLAYGFPIDSKELRWAAEWFATPFPTDGSEVIDSIEMTKLEGLLNLHPDDPGVKSRLEQLVRQRNGHHFEIEGTGTDSDEKRNSVFDTLWSLKVLLMARSRNVLHKVMNERSMLSSLNHMTRIANDDTHIALALRLHYQLAGKLNQEQTGRLHDLLNSAETHLDVWGMQRPDMWERVKDIVSAMHQRQLPHSVIEQSGQINNVRKIVMNLCYVIESLAPLHHAFPEIEPLLKRSLAMWWRQFHGENAPSNIHSLFESEYDFLMVMCRTMVAIGSYAEEPLSALCWMPSLRKMSETFRANSWEDEEFITRTLREWIKVDVRTHKYLNLGLSEANVVRINPALWSPMDSSQVNMLPKSLIVKYGPLEEINRERANFERLPARIQSSFVQIPAPSYTDIYSQRGFVIMEDLDHYQTFYEIYDRLLKPDRPLIGAQLSAFLIDMHRGEIGVTEMSSSNHLRDLYLLPMLQHIDFIAERMQEGDLFTQEDVDRFQTTEQQLNDLIADIMRQQRFLRHFPLSYMHGDLHSRNIMIRPHQRNGSTRRFDFDFKLIDLESLRDDGDAAHDAGQLLVDLTLLHLTGKPSLARPVYVKLDAMRDEILEAYLNFGHERKDDTFSIRLALGKARALLRIAKGGAKRGEKYVQERDYLKAKDSVQFLQNLTEESIAHLQEAQLALG
jgi:hypothetical protein